MSCTRVAGLFTLVFAAEAVAVTIRVPTDAPTIQTAIDLAQRLDTIVVEPGGYFEGINFGGKKLTVRSTAPTDASVVAATIIDAGGAGSVVTFTGSEDSRYSILDGFTIRGGTIGIDAHRSLAFIRHCVIRDNSLYGISQADGNIEDCQIFDNDSTGLYDCDGTIRRSLIRNNNKANKNGAGLQFCDGTIIDSRVEETFFGPGVAGGSIDIIRCVITGNLHGVSTISYLNGTPYAGNIEQSFIVGNWGNGISGDIYGGTVDPGIIRNTVIAGNRGYGVRHSYKDVLNCTVTGNFDYGLADHSGAIRHCIIWDNGAGPLLSSTTPVFSGTTNPYFVQLGHWTGWPDDAWVNGDYHLQSNSLYIDTGDPNYLSDPNAVTQDIEGSPRVIGSRVDIGAYEFGGACEGPDFDGDGTPDICDLDIDGDGVPNVIDVCDDTPQGIPVDDQGRPYADLNHDCTVDLRDYAIFQNSMIGP